jgi:hypothetical protein
VSKTVWLVLAMGAITMLLLTLGMMLSLEKFQTTPAAEWVKLAEQIGREFKAEPVSIRVSLHSVPRVMVINYSSLLDSHFDLTAQNGEMEKVARFALKNFKDAKKVDEVQVTRSETHGRGCFRQTYVGNFTLPNPVQKEDAFPFPGTPSSPPRR